MTTINIVWNNNKTEGFATTDPQLAYEARKGAESNCYKQDGSQSKLAVAFCDIYSGEEDCTIEIINNQPSPPMVNLEVGDSRLKDLPITSYEFECDSDIQSFLIDFYKALVLSHYELFKVSFVNQWYAYIHITTEPPYRYWKLEYYNDKGEIRDSISGDISETNLDRLQDWIVRNNSSALIQRRIR